MLTILNPTQFYVDCKDRSKSLIYIVNKWDQALILVVSHKSLPAIAKVIYLFLLYFLTNSQPCILLQLLCALMVDVYWMTRSKSFWKPILTTSTGSHFIISTIKSIKNSVIHNFPFNNIFWLCLVVLIFSRCPVITSFSINSYIFPSTIVQVTILQFPIYSPFLTFAILQLNGTIK